MKSFFTFLFLGSIFFAHSQNKISGYITDKNNNKIQGATLTIAELRKETQTDATGFFEIKNLLF